MTTQSPDNPPRNPAVDAATPTPEAALIAAARTSLDDMAAVVAVDDAERLAMAREAALAAVPQGVESGGLMASRGTPRTRHVERAKPWPAFGLAAAAVASVALVLWWPLADRMPGGNTALDDLRPLEDLALVSAAEGVDFYADVAFYLWLGEQTDAG